MQARREAAGRAHPGGGRSPQAEAGDGARPGGGGGRIQQPAGARPEPAGGTRAKAGDGARPGGGGGGGGRVPHSAGGQGSLSL